MSKRSAICTWEFVAKASSTGEFGRFQTANPQRWQVWEGKSAYIVMFCKGCVATFESTPSRPSLPRCVHLSSWRPNLGVWEFLCYYYSREPRQCNQTSRCPACFAKGVATVESTPSRSSLPRRVHRSSWRPNLGSWDFFCYYYSREPRQCN